MDPVVSIDKSDGRVMVLASGIFPFPAIKSAEGTWSVGTYSADDLKDNFERVVDPKVVAAFVNEVQKAIEAEKKKPKGFHGIVEAMNKYSEKEQYNKENYFDCLTEVKKNNKNIVYEIKNGFIFNYVKKSLNKKDYIECSLCGAIQIDTIKVIGALTELLNNGKLQNEIEIEIIENIIYEMVEPEPEIDDVEQFEKWAKQNEDRKCECLDPENYGCDMYAKNKTIVVGLDKKCECFKFWGKMVKSEKEDNERFRE